MSLRLGACAVAVAVLLTWMTALGVAAAEIPNARRTVLTNWYGLVLELVRHTATYSPPVASRAFGYLGVTAYEASIGGSGQLVTLSGQLNELEAVPQRVVGEAYDDAVVLDAALAGAVERFFANTGPTGQRAIAAARKKWAALASTGVAPDVVARSAAFGRAVAARIYDWSLTDGGETIENMGFPLEYDRPVGNARWVPTSLIAQQQVPLLPHWGSVRPFAMPEGSTCAIPAPLAYSEDPASPFYREALEVYETSRMLSPEQKAIARFWSDDPMLSSTPPGHWISIALQVVERERLSLDESVDLLARLGIAQADAFIGCWHEKFRYNLIRPVTYIRQHIDPKWEPLLNTPPFPEYPSGHSTASAAAATVLTALFGDNFPFEDATGARDGLKSRSQQSFWAAAEEAGTSRLLGGIHFRSAVIRGLEQGRCIGGYVVALRTRR